MFQTEAQLTQLKAEHATSVQFGTDLPSHSRGQASGLSFKTSVGATANEDGNSEKKNCKNVRGENNMPVLVTRRLKKKRLKYYATYD